MPHVLHVVLAILAALAGGALWGGIAGVLRATTGANEVITTIMLNWTALWVGVYLFSLGGPLQNDAQPDVPVSNDVVPGARLHVFWGDAELQGLHIGLFIALAAAVFFGIFIRRSARGYEARAVGLNPEAARYGGIRVGPTYVWVMALCGLFAGLAGAMDVLGWQFRVATNDIQVGSLGFIGIAVALLGRNTAIGTCAAALLFGALLQGTSTRNLDPAVFDPSLAQNLTYIIQGLVILLITANAVIIWLVRRRRRVGGTGGGEHMTAIAAPLVTDQDLRSGRLLGWAGVVVAIVAALHHAPAVRGPHRPAVRGARRGVARAAASRRCAAA